MYERKTGGYTQSIGGSPVTRRPTVARPTPTPAPATRAAAAPAPSAVRRPRPFNPERLRPGYRELRTLDVPRMTRKAAEAALALAAADLGLGRPVIGWYTADDGLDAGYTHYPAEPNRIFLRAGLEPYQAARTALHEARHLWQGRRDWPGYSAEQQRRAEEDAQAYVEEAAAAWLD